MQNSNGKCAKTMKARAHTIQMLWSDRKRETEKSTNKVSVCRVCVCVFVCACHRWRSKSARAASSVLNLFFALLRLRQRLGHRNETTHHPSKSQSVIFHIFFSCRSANYDPWPIDSALPKSTQHFSCRRSLNVAMPPATRVERFYPPNNFNAAHYNVFC